MQPLVDGDILIYECAFAAETAWKAQNPGMDVNERPPPFDNAADLIDNRISHICAVVDATQPPIIYLTGKKNFRYEIAKRTPYKDGRSKKPFHYKNLTAYIKGKYEFRLTEGLEADDLMAIEATQRPGVTIICTRDKDLRSVPGWHYGWELGNQPQFGPEEVSMVGRIELSKDRKKIKGSGLLFFYSQCLTGDTVDSIPGLPKCGPVKAYEILEQSKTEEEAFRSVLSAYQASYGEEQAAVELLEQGRLLHMTRKLNEDGSPQLWEFPRYD
jgi:5'-3' exonuclease